MANTYSSCFYHIVFSTKHRDPLIKPAIENRVWEYVGGIARKHRMIALQVGGIEDHLHALVLSPPRYSPSQIAQYLKGESSKWIHEELPDLRFSSWQDGYGVFTVNKSLVPKVIDYIKNQHAHHQNESFEDEYRRLMALPGIDYDERYVFD
ncbi:MAG: IS200/IS605 family transposase [Pyrinomonadaceae bacterium]